MTDPRGKEAVRVSSLGIEGILELVDEYVVLKGEGPDDPPDLPPKPVPDPHKMVEDVVDEVVDNVAHKRGCNQERQ